MYRLLVRLYPRRVREELGTELLEQFFYLRDERLRTKRRLGLRFWTGLLLDAVVSSWKERHEPLDARGRAPMRSQGGGDGMKGWVDDLRYAARRLWRSPGFALTALAILVAGIGVNSTAFSVVNALLLQAPPFEEPARVVQVLQHNEAGTPNSTSYPAYLDMTRVSGVFSSVSAFYADNVFLEQGDALAPVMVEYGTASYMEVIGLSTSRGSWFGTEHDDPNGAPAAVLTHRMWMDRMAADPDVLGRTLRINGNAVTVIGVGPTDFNGGAGPAPVDMWLSISSMAATGGRFGSLVRRQDHPFVVRARLAAGVSVTQASEAMDRLASDLAATYPDLNEGRGISVLSSLDVRISPEADAEMVPIALFTMAVVVLVLLIGTLNLANLLLVRSTARAREIAVRLALGASRTRVIRVVLAEAVLLSTLGGAGGLVVALTAARVLRNSRFDFALPLMIDLRLDARVVLFTIAVSALAGVVFGLLPAIRATKRGVNPSLRDDASSGLGSRRRFGLTGSLVVAQVAVSLLLLAVAGVFVESLVRAQGADPGFAWERTAFVQVNTAPLEMSGEATVQLFDQLEERIEGLPGVARVTSSIAMPAAQRGTTTLLLGVGLGGVDRPAEIPWNYVALNYFDVLGVPLLHGRLFDPSDLEGSEATVVSEAFARTYWGKSDVVGEEYRSESSPDEAREIVGVVADVAVRALGEAPTPSIYWPITFGTPRLSLIFEVIGSDSEAIRAVNAVVREVDSRIMVIGAGTMSDHLGASLERQRLVSGLLGGLGLMSLALAMLGYTESSRSRCRGVAERSASESHLGPVVTRWSDSSCGTSHSWSWSDRCSGSASQFRWVA